MKKRFVLHLTDNEIVLHKESGNKTYYFVDGIEPIQTELKNLFSLSPRIPLYLLIDCNHQDIREEQLPPLRLWDRMRLLSHKKAEWASLGPFQGYHYFKQDGQFFLQWVNLTQNDFLMPWLSWITSLSNPLNISFVSLEAGQFLKKHFPKIGKYSMLIYKTSHTIRYAIFKDKRLLLSRFFSGEENLRTSLHFLSRLHPDIHEKFQVLNLIKGISLTFPHVITLSDPHIFIDFLIAQKKKTLSLNIKSSAHNQWIRKGGGCLFICSLVFTGLTIYQGLRYKNETNILLFETNKTKKIIKNRKILLYNKDIILLRLALAHYHHIQSHIRLPFKTLEKLAVLFEQHHLRLQSLIWRYEQFVDVEIRFFMQDREQTSLADQFNSLITFLTDAFPNSHIQVIEAPFKSGSHETYEYPPTQSPPMGHVRIVGL